jgi:hypothetical protein
VTGERNEGQGEAFRIDLAGEVVPAPQEAAVSGEAAVMQVLETEDV